MDDRIHTEAMFPARLSAWRSAREFLDRFCATASVARMPGLRLNLIVEELFANTINHGHGGDSDFLVWISLSRRGTGVNVTYLDQGPPFNPLAMPVGQLAVPVEERKIGGLGIFLTTELTVSADYVYIYGRNRLRFVLQT